MRKLYDFHGNDSDHTTRDKLNAVISCVFSHLRENVVHYDIEDNLITDFFETDNDVVEFACKYQITDQNPNIIIRFILLYAYMPNEVKMTNVGENNDVGEKNDVGENDECVFKTTHERTGCFMKNDADSCDLGSDPDFGVFTSCAPKEAYVLHLSFRLGLELWTKIANAKLKKIQTNPLVAHLELIYRESKKKDDNIQTPINACLGYILFQLMCKDLTEEEGLKTLKTILHGDREDLHMYSKQLRDSHLIEDAFVMSLVQHFRCEDPNSNRKSTNHLSIESISPKLLELMAFDLEWWCQDYTHKTDYYTIKNPLMLYVIWITRMVPYLLFYTDISVATSPTATTAFLQTLELEITSEKIE